LDRSLDRPAEYLDGLPTKTMFPGRFACSIRGPCVHFVRPRSRFGMFHEQGTSMWRLNLVLIGLGLASIALLLFIPEATAARGRSGSRGSGSRGNASRARAQRARNARVAREAASHRNDLRARALERSNARRERFLESRRAARWNANSSGGNPSASNGSSGSSGSNASSSFGSAGNNSPMGGDSPMGGAVPR
jgi:hypothetical protein